MKTQLVISKLDAAKRQLETVIRLYFSFGDPVSIHTLTAAAYNVIRDINKKKGGNTMLAKDGFMERVKPGHEKEVWAKVTAAETFFKHADRDHNATLDFNPEQSDFLILEACSVYSQLSGEIPPLFRLYQTWFIANHQNLFLFTEEEKRLISMGATEVKALGRENYFQLCLPLISRVNT